MQTFHLALALFSKVKMIIGKEPQKFTKIIVNMQTDYGYSQKWYSECKKSKKKWNKHNPKASKEVLLAVLRTDNQVVEIAVSPISIFDSLVVSVEIFAVFLLLEISVNVEW